MSLHKGSKGLGCSGSHGALLALAWQAVLVRASARLLKRALSETDERSKLEGELVSGIEVVKCSAWEVRSWDSHDQNLRGSTGVNIRLVEELIFDYLHWIIEPACNSIWAAVCRTCFMFPAQEPFWQRINNVRNKELGILWKSFIIDATNACVSKVPTDLVVSVPYANLVVQHPIAASRIRAAVMSDGTCTARIVPSVLEPQHSLNPAFRPSVEVFSIDRIS